MTSDDREPVGLTRRERLEAEAAAFVGGWLDHMFEMYGDEFEVDTYAIAFGLRVRAGHEEGVDVGWLCSDDRYWVQSGLFRVAAAQAEARGLEGD